MNKLLLSGQVDDRDEQIKTLRAQIEKLLQDGREMQSQLSRERAGVAAVRHQLNPLYRALQLLFEEMDQVAGFTNATEPQSNAKWDAIKQRLAPRLREAIDILLVQKNLKRTQMASALKMGYNNCTKNVVGVLIRQGLVVESGGYLVLKEL